MLAEASISLLDEIDRPVADMEADEDFEVIGEDAEDGGDDEEEPFEPDLGWTEDGQAGRNDGLENHDDEDFTPPETMGGFPRGVGLPYEARAEQKALFDPRPAARSNGGPGWGRHPIPSFPHEPPGRAPFYIDEEIRRLRRELATSPKRRRK